MKRALFFLFVLISSSVRSTPTVVCLHGFLSDSRTMYPIKNMLERAGFETCLWNYPSRKFTIERHATDLIIQLQEIARSKPGEPIYFVAHSIGALIIRSAMNLPGCPSEAKCGKAVLIAPPNQGSSLARKFSNSALVSITLGNHSGYQLMTYMPRDIEFCFGPFPASMQILVLAGCQGIHNRFTEPNDGYLSVEETKLNTPHKHVVLPLTHSSLLNSYPSLSYVQDFFCYSTCAEME